MLADLDYVTDTERDALVKSPSRGWSSDRPIHRLFESVAKQIPDATAAVFAGGGADVAITYRELNARANRFARWLQSRGVGIEDRVVICADASIARLAAILGTMKAGAAYVPLDPSIPPVRLDEMIADCGASLVLDDEILAAERREGSDHDLPDTAGPDNLAYIIYTSGSTGRPKGVAVEHGALHHLADAQIRAFRIDCEEPPLVRSDSETASPGDMSCDWSKPSARL